MGSRGKGIPMFCGVSFICKRKKHTVPIGGPKGRGKRKNERQFQVKRVRDPSF